MPYIKRADYVRAARLPITPGELNYAITLKIIDDLGAEHNAVGLYHAVRDLCESYVNRRGLTYTIGNEVVGVIACAALELMRRCGTTGAVDQVTEVLADVGNHIYDNILAPYEDGKIKENGDVYPTALLK